MGYKWNPISSQLDLVNPATAPFDTDTILTHALTPFGNPLMSYDPAMLVWYRSEFELVFDIDGNIVTS